MQSRINRWPYAMGQFFTEYKARAKGLILNWLVPRILVEDVRFVGISIAVTGAVLNSVVFCVITEEILIELLV